MVYAFTFCEAYVKFMVHLEKFFPQNSKDLVTTLLESGPQL